MRISDGSSDVCSSDLSMSALMLYHGLHAEGSQADPLRVIQGLAQAIGFLCAGLIFVRSGDVRNMTTAANLWMAATLGIAIGLGHYVLVAIASLIALVMPTAVRVFRSEEHTSELQSPMRTP